MQPEEEQLKELFKNTIQMVIDTVKNDDIEYFDDKDKYNEYVNNVSNNLIYEVKIRTIIWEEYNE